MNRSDLFPTFVELHFIGDDFEELIDLRFGDEPLEKVLFKLDESMMTKPIPHSTAKLIVASREPLNLSREAVL